MATSYLRSGRSRKGRAGWATAPLACGFRGFGASRVSAYRAASPLWLHFVKVLLRSVRCPAAAQHHRRAPHLEPASWPRTPPADCRPVSLAHTHVGFSGLHSWLLPSLEVVLLLQRLCYLAWIRVPAVVRAGDQRLGAGVRQCHAAASRKPAAPASSAHFQESLWDWRAWEL